MHGKYKVLKIYNYKKEDTKNGVLFIKTYIIYLVMI